MNVKELREQLKELPDELELRIVAPNAPPYITEFRIIPIGIEEENE